MSERDEVEYVARVVRVRTLCSKIEKIKNYAKNRKFFLMEFGFSESIWIN